VQLLTDGVENLIRAGLRNPVRVSILEKKENLKRYESDTIQRTPATLTNFYMILEPDKKMNQLIRFIQQHLKQKIMVFFSTCAVVDYFSVILPPLLKRSRVSITIFPSFDMRLKLPLSSTYNVTVSN